MAHTLRRTALAFAVVLAVFLLAPRNSSGQPPSDLRTPPPPPTPHLNGPRVYGVRPGHQFLYRIPCTGNRPIKFSARNLPASLKLNRRTGIISGTAPEKPADFSVTIKASNALGADTRELKIVVGDTIGLTPQMGWNDWYSYYDRISDSDVRAAAAAMISSGMADYGYQFVDIDDCWARKPGSDDPALNGPVRDAQGNILPNARFPRHARAHRIHPLAWPQGRNLQRARPSDLRQV